MSNNGLNNSKKNIARARPQKSTIEQMFQFNPNFSVSQVNSYDTNNNKTKYIEKEREQNIQRGAKPKCAMKMHDKMFDVRKIRFSTESRSKLAFVIFIQRYRSDSRYIQQNST